MPTSSRVFQMFAVLSLLTIIVSTVQAKRGCASFGHSCFGGHGKRADIPGADQLQPMTNISPSDLQGLEVLRQFCTLQPESYLRLAPLFRRLMETYAGEDEPLPRK